MANIIMLRRASLTAWTAHDPVLAEGEVGVELSDDGTPQAVKVGDGTSEWNSLAYLVKPANTSPKPIVFGGSGNAGSSREFARADHIHEAPVPVDSAQRITSPDYDYAIDPVLDKLILADCNNTNVTITMPVIAQSMGREFIIRHHGGANIVKIAGQPGDTVDGLGIITLTTEKDFVRLINDGKADWCLVGGSYT